MEAFVREHDSKKKIFELKGKIPKKVLDFLAQEYGNRLEMKASKEEFAEIFEKSLDTGTKK
jgi:hypothetical protein